MHGSKYYSCSNIWRLSKGALCVLATVAVVAGCAAGPNQVAKDASRTSFAALSGEARRAELEKLTQLPVVVFFQRGDRVPVNVELDSSVAELEVPELTLVAKRDFYLLLRPDGGFLLSTDGVDFESNREKNYFSFGFGVRREQATALHLRLGIRPEASQPAARRRGD